MNNDLFFKTGCLVRGCFLNSAQSVYAFFLVSHTIHVFKSQRYQINNAIIRFKIAKWGKLNLFTHGLLLGSVPFLRNSK